MCAGAAGTLWPSLAYWVILTALHVAGCALLSLNVYYVGDFTLGTLTTY